MKYTLFSASWCSNCTLPKTLIAENNLPVDVLDIDENFDRAAEAGVKPNTSITPRRRDTNVGIKRHYKILS